MFWNTELVKLYTDIVSYENELMNLTKCQFIVMVTWYGIKFVCGMLTLMWHCPKFVAYDC